MRSLILVLFLVSCLHLLAAPIQLTSATQADLFNIQSQKDNSTTIRFQLPSIDVEKEVINQKEYYRLTHKDAAYLLEKGKPELPIFSTFIAVPIDGDISIETVSYETKSLDCIRPIPSLGCVSVEDPQRVFTVDENCYGSSQIYPQDIVNRGAPQILRDVRIVSVQVNPFAYNPINNSIEVRNNIVIRVTSNSRSNRMFLNNEISRSFEPLYESVIQNYDQIRDENTVYQPRSILMIYPSNVSTSCLNKIKDLMNWKRQKGFDVTIASTAVTGSSNTAIKSYIQNAYNTWPVKPEYVILIGDAEGSISLPYWRIPELQGSTYNGEGDYPFTLLTADNFGDVFIGRISVSTEIELATVVAKIKLIERNPNTDLSWYSHVLLVGDTSPTGYSTVDTNLYIKDMMDHYYDGFTFHEFYGDQPNASSFDTTINQGCSWFNYRGWIGMSDWASGHVSTLTNTNKLVNGVFITCNTGAYAGSSVSEDFLRAGSPTQLKGGCFAIGMSTSHTIPPYNNCLDMGIFHGLYRDGMRDMGQAFLRGKMNLFKNYGVSNLIEARTFAQISNLFGDPSMDIWVTPPKSMIANYPAIIRQGTNYVEVSVTDAQLMPLKNAWVTISQPNDSLFATGYTNNNGIVYLAIDPTKTGSATIAVTKPDYIAVLGSITIQSELPVVGFVQSLIDDDNNGASSGNADNLIQASETIELGTIIKNYLPTNVSNITATLRCSDPYITISDSTTSYGSCESNQTAIATDNFAFHVADSCPNQYNVRYFLVIHANNEDQISSFTLPINNGHLVVTATIIQSNDTILDPGETANLLFTIHNDGNYAIDDISAVVRSMNNLVQITDSTAVFGTINQNQEATCVTDGFEVHASSQVLPGMQIPMELKFTNPSGFVSYLTLTVPIGVVHVTDPLGPDAYGYVCYDSGDTSYDQCPTFDWIEINPSQGGSGTSLGIVDNAENEDTTAVKTVTLPFTFTFYSKEYNEITVASNGFIAMGKSRINDFRNWHVPGPGGPSPMIAAFWDDLRFQANSGIYSYYNTENHYYVVEWYNVKHGETSSPETFQVILYDPSYYQTTTADGPIKIQYLDFNNTDSGVQETYTGNYCTVGLEDQTGNVGLEYTFNNAYPTAARTITDNTALYFTGVPISYNQSHLVLGQRYVHDSNNNNIVESGETVDLGIELENIGMVTANNVFSRLVTQDPNVTMISDTSSYNNIPSNQTLTNLNYFSFSISDNCANDYTIPFTLVITSGNLTWNRNFSIKVFKGTVDIQEFFFSDALGNGNGITDPGEMVELVFIINNSTDYTAKGGSITFSTTSDLIPFMDTECTYDAIPAHTKLQIPVHISTVSTAPLGSIIPITYHLTGSNSINSSVLLGIGDLNYFFNFEDSDGGFVPISNQTTNSWAWGIPINPINAHSGEKCWATNFGAQYPAMADFRLRSLLFYIQEGATLQFYQHYDFEQGHDGGYVRISTDGGNTYSVIQPVGGYPCSNISSLSSPGYSGSSNGWQLAQFDLSAYENTNAIIQWRFKCDAVNGAAGWYIDDVSISGSSKAAGKISGNVSVANGQANLAKTRVTAQDMMVYPDSTGNFSIYLLPGDYTLNATQPHYEAGNANVNDVTSTSNISGINMSMTPLQAPYNLSYVINEDQNNVALTWQYDVAKKPTRQDKNERISFVQFKLYKQKNTGELILVDSTTTNQYVDTIEENNHYRYFVEAVYNEGVSDTTNNVNFFYHHTTANDPDIPSVTLLDQNYPNPFNPTTTFKFSLAKKTAVSLKVYNVKGQLVKTLAHGLLNAGYHTVLWNGKDNHNSSVASGIYFYRLETGDKTFVRKALLLK